MIPPFMPPSGDSNRGNRQSDSQMQGPVGAPPGNTPQRPDAARGLNTRAVDPGSIRNCMWRNTYVWLDNGQEFWFFPIQSGPRSVSGFRWTPRFGWTYMGVSLNRIDFFTCI